MENKQINFFKAKDINTVLKPFKKGTVVSIDNFELREKQNELKTGLYGWYAICPSKELKKNKIHYLESCFLLNISVPNIATNDREIFFYQNLIIYLSYSSER